MEVNYTFGKREDFWKFTENIEKDDKVGILTHNDLDAVASSIFLEEILKKKGLNVFFRKFIVYGEGIFEKSLGEMNKKGITKLFVLDLKLDDYSDFSKVKDKFGFDLFLIDHHPLSENLKNQNLKNVIKTDSTDCVTLTLFDLASSVVNMDKWEWLLCATLVAEISYKNPENMKIIQKKYPKTKEKFIMDSDPGRLAKKIGSTIVYFQEDLGTAYKLVKEKDLKEIDDIYEIIQAEIDSCLEEIEETAEYFSEKKLCIAFIKPKFSITSTVSSILSFKPENLDKIFVIISEIRDRPGFYKVSSRNQSGDVNLDQLMRKAVVGLENAMGGGHPKASAATFMKKDLGKFKENLLKSL